MIIFTGRLDNLKGINGIIVIRIRVQVKSTCRSSERDGIPTEVEFSGTLLCRSEFTLLDLEFVSHITRRRHWHQNGLQSSHRKKHR